jgi:hypothetical protein
MVNDQKHHKNLYEGGFLARAGVALARVPGGRTQA